MKPLMNKQEVFDKVATHLLTQRKRSIGTNSRSCAYRNKELDTTCAIGSLIPKGKYKKTFEGKSVSHVDVLNALPFRINTNEIYTPKNIDELWACSDLRLLRTLQKTHDGYSVTEWKEELRNIAKKFSLKTDVLKGLK